MGLLLLTVLLSLLYPFYYVHALHHECSGDGDCPICETLQAISNQHDSQNYVSGVQISLNEACSFILSLLVFSFFILQAVTPVSLKVKKSE